MDTLYDPVSYLEEQECLFRGRKKRKSKGSKKRRSSGGKKRKSKGSKKRRKSRK